MSQGAIYIFGLFFILSGFITTYSNAENPVIPASFLHRLDHEELLKAMPEIAIDSSWQRDDQQKDYKALVFAPVNFVGFPAIAQARLTNDSLDRIDFYVLYHEHKGVKPFMPYARMGFAKATLDDFVRLRYALAKIYGEPTIMAETFFEYMPSKERPYIVANFKNMAVDISVTPSSDK